MSTATLDEELLQLTLPPLTDNAINRFSVDDLLAKIFDNGTLQAPFLPLPSLEPCPLAPEPSPLATISESVAAEPQAKARRAFKVRTRFTVLQRLLVIVATMALLFCQQGSALTSVMADTAQATVQAAAGGDDHLVAPLGQTAMVGNSGDAKPGHGHIFVGSQPLVAIPAAVKQYLVIHPALVAGDQVAPAAAPAAKAASAIAAASSSASAANGSTSSAPASNEGTAPAPVPASGPVAQGPVDPPVDSGPPAAAPPVAQPPVAAPPAQQNPPAAQQPTPPPAASAPPAASQPAPPADTTDHGPAMQDGGQGDAAHGEVGHNGETPAPDQTDLHLDNNAPVVASDG